MVGAPVHPLRFRANLYVEGWPAWHEFDLLDHTLAIGDVRLKVVKRIVRCAAVNVDPDTAARDLAIPQALQRRLGHADCGIYAEVIEGGTISAERYDRGGRAGVVVVRLPDAIHVIAAERTKSSYPVEDGYQYAAAYAISSLTSRDTDRQPSRTMTVCVVIPAQRSNRLLRFVATHGSIAALAMTVHTVSRSRDTMRPRFA